MTQRSIDTAVAAATGESLSLIRCRGFGIADSADVNFDPEPRDMPPQWLDWDQNDSVEPERRIHSRRKSHAV